jgi:hypothetical protein
VLFREFRGQISSSLLISVIRLIRGRIFLDLLSFRDNFFFKSLPIFIQKPKPMFSETYYFTRGDYNKDGISYKTGILFTDFIGECEHDFYRKYFFQCANCLFANSATMYLIKSCLCVGEDEDFGMDLINGEINLSANLEIEKYSRRPTTYALGSKIKCNKDEPLFLIIDENVLDNEFNLKYIDENNESHQEEIPVPANGVMISI